MPHSVHRSGVILLAALLPGLLLAAGQNSGGTAVIQGRVIAGDTGLPLPGATVQVLSEDTVRTGAVRRLATDARGRFEITGLAAGAYRLIASPPADKPMYLATDRQSRSAEPVIELEADETRRDIDLALPRTGAIGGRLSDQFGQPVAGAAVHVLGRGTGGRLLPAPSPFAVSFSDDYGRYRGWGLPAGAYVVRVEPRSPAERASGTREGYVRTYYLQATALSEATPVRLGTSQDLDNVDVRLELYRTFQASGLVLLPNGDAAVGAEVNLDFVDERGIGTGQRQIANGEGRFTFVGLVPAKYELRASARDNSPIGLRLGGSPLVASGPVPFTITDTDTGDLSVRLHYARVVTGTVTTDEGGPPPFPPGGLRVAGLAADPADRALAPAGPSDVDGRYGFGLPGVLAPILVRVQGLPAGWFLRAVQPVRGNIVDEPFDFRSMTPRVRLVVSDRGATLAGTLEDAGGRPAALRDVRLFPDGEEAPQSWASRLRRTLTDRRGSFQLEALAPGAYIVLAADRQIPMPLDADAWAEIRRLGTPVSLREQGRETVTLTVVEWPY